jgi:hypothetical protein
VDFAFADEAVCFSDEGGGDEAVVVEGFRTRGSRDLGRSRDKPAQVRLQRSSGIQRIGAVVGLGEVPPGVVEFCLLRPVFKAVGFDEGEEVDAELGFAAAGEFEGGDGRFA